jgi:riboflavin kinase / FMN adenylyltransferase
MKIIKFNKTSKAKDITLILGNFDGVHKGHKRLISKAVKYSRRKKLPCFAMTFDPHPQEVVAPARGLSLLTTLSERIELIKDLGVDGVIVKEFNKKIAELSPEKFISDFLIDHLKVKEVFVGFDFAFGHKRAGSISFLKKLGNKYGFVVHVISPYKAHGHLVKSSTIRDMLVKGDFTKAIKLLGHPYIFTGTVVRGKGRGKGLGFPTANITVAKDKLIPKHGVYYGKIKVKSEKRKVNEDHYKKAAIFIGSRPTFGDESFAIEAFILNFKKNIRGKTIELYVYERLRDEIHFSDIERLKKQIAADVKKLQETRL